MNVAPPMPFAGIRRPNSATYLADNSLSLLTLLCALNVFIVSSRVPELLTLYFNFNFRIVFVLGGMCLVGLLFQGGLTSGLQSIQGKMFIFLTLWMIPASVFGFWRGGSFDLFVNVWLKSVMLFFLISGSIRTKRDLGVLLNALALSAVFVVFQGFYFGTNESERGAISIVGGKGLSFSNSNGLAMALGLGIPFLLFQVASSSSIFIRFVCFVTSLLGVLLVLRTGSRGGLLALLIVVFRVFIRATVLQKGIMVLILIVATAVGGAFIPKAAYERHLTLFGRVETVDAFSAEASSQLRIALLKESILMTFYHPLLGVGPGNFITASAKNASEKGEREVWLESHNSYTRISSETGIPGFLLFTGILFTSLLRVRALGKRASAFGDEYLVNAGFYASLSLGAYAVLIFFDSSAFQFQLPMLTGLAVAILNVAERSKSTAGLNPATMPIRLQRQNATPGKTLNSRNSSIGSQSRFPKYANLNPQPRIPGGQ